MSLTPGKGKPLPIVKRVITKTNTRPPIIKIQSLYKQDVIYESNTDTLLGEGRVKILNKLNRLNKINRTIATITKCEDGAVIEKNSDNIVKLIGQSQYDFLLSALCSILSKDLMVRALYSLLTTPIKTASVYTQTDSVRIEEKAEQNLCDVDKLQLESIPEKKHKRRVRRQGLTPYVISVNKDVTKKKNSTQRINKLIIKVPNEKSKRLSDENVLRSRRISSEFCADNLGDNSNDSIGKFSISGLSVASTDSLLYNPESLIDNVDKHTKCSTPGLIQNLDTDLESSSSKYPTTGQTHSPHSDVEVGRLNKCSTSTQIYSPHSEVEVNRYTKCPTPGQIYSLNPDVDSTENNMPPHSVMQLYKPDANGGIKYHELFNRDEQKKILLKSALDEWLCCNRVDEDGNLPLHAAVTDNDVQKVKRQCLALKSRKISLDTPGSGDWTALKMAISKKESSEITETLLKFGADPNLEDEDYRNAVHLAAESSIDQLKVVINYFKQNAKLILEENNLLRSEYLNKPVQELESMLLQDLCSRIDNQGYTPLMLASKAGLDENVMVLLEAAPKIVNKQMPTSGNTALYLAIDAAYTDSINHGNKSKVRDNFHRTIENLVGNGADPSIDNLSGHNVNILLTEFNIPDLSMLVANKLTSVKFFDGSELEDSKNFSNYVVIKNDDDTIYIKDIKETKFNKKRGPKMKQDVTVDKKNSLIIVRSPEVISIKKKTPEVPSNAQINTKVLHNWSGTGSEIKDIEIQGKKGLKRKIGVSNSPASKVRHN